MITALFRLAVNLIQISSPLSTLHIKPVFFSCPCLANISVQFHRDTIRQIPHAKASYVEDQAEISHEEIEAPRNIDMHGNKDDYLLTGNEYWCQ
jgi:hypothetical protein